MLSGCELYPRWVPLTVIYLEAGFRSQSSVPIKAFGDLSMREILVLMLAHAVPPAQPDIL